MNEINCTKKDQSLIHATKTSSILESVGLNFAGVRIGSRDNVHSHLRHAKRPMAVRGGGGGAGG